MVRDLFFFTWKAKNQPILSINAVSPQTAKQRILAALWHSPVLPILQTENLKRKASQIDWRILYNICTSLLPQGAASRAVQADLFTSGCKERLHKQGETAIWVKSGCRRVKMWSIAWRLCEVKPSVFALTGYAVTSAASLFFCLWKKGKKMVAGPGMFRCFHLSLKFVVTFYFTLKTVYLGCFDV